MKNILFQSLLFTYFSEVYNKCLIPYFLNTILTGQDLQSILIMPSIKKVQSQQQSQQGKSQNATFLNDNNIKSESKRKNQRFPFRPTINMGLIILITFQVYIVVTSHIYLRGSLNRSFLQLYVQEDKYPEIYDGLSYYLKVRNVSDIRDGLQYTFEHINAVKNNSFLEMNLKNTEIILSVEYLNNLQNSASHEKQFIINPQVGIIQPFNMSNTESIQRFLLEVNWFKLSVNNITLESQGFRQKYLHEIIYEFQQGLQIDVQFQFSIDNSQLDSVTVDKPQANYIYVIKTFYFIVLIFAITSMFLNYRYVRRAVRVLFQILGKNNKNEGYRQQSINFNDFDLTNSMVSPQDLQQIQISIKKQIIIHNLTLSTLTFKHYLYIIEFDIIFSILSNLFTIIGSFYLLIGFENQIIIGISCLTAWMTIFKFIRTKKKLVLMYELIKLSMLKVLFFFVEFFPVFLAYTFLGMCLFPKVSFYSSLSKAVTTLVSLMMGDSIQMITSAMMEKNSVTLAILYIFSFVLLFMHAIHNTLTSLIKEAFILKKIELIHQEKNQKKQKNFLYISELKCKADLEKDQLPIKLTSSLKKELIRNKYLKQTKSMEATLKKWVREWEKLSFNEKWYVEENSSLISNDIYIKQLQRRLSQVHSLIKLLSISLSEEKYLSPMEDQSLLTND